MDAPVIIHSPTIFCDRLPLNHRGHSQRKSIRIMNGDTLKLSKRQRTVTSADPVPEAPPDDPSQEEG
jgi:hypothetical protein